MQEWIRQIIIYVILVTVLRGLIMKPQYEQYFRFFSGIVLILLVVSPVLRVLHQDTAWHDTVEQYLFQMFCKCTNKGENIWICYNKVLPLLLTKR
mgnify:CR=1 FL=1